MSRRHARRGLPPMWRMALVFVLAATAPVVVMLKFGIPAGLATAFLIGAAFVVCDVLAAFSRRRYRRNRRPLTPPFQAAAVSSLELDPFAYLGRVASTRHAAAGHVPDPWSHVRDRDD